MTHESMNEAMSNFPPDDFFMPPPDMDESNRLPDMAERLFNLKQSEKELKDQYEAVKNDRMQAEESLCLQMENAGIESFRTRQGTFYTREDWYASINVDDRPKAFQWLRDNDLGSLIKETVNARTLSAMAKERMAEDEPLPEEIKVIVKKKVGIRKK